MSKFFKALEQAQRDEALGASPRPHGEFESPPPPALDRPGAADRPPPEPLGAEEFALESGDGLDEHLVSLITPAAFEAEQYRALRHILEQMHKTANLKVVAVSSPGTGDGKTLTAINLSGALAQAPETRVLLVDADLRRPSIDKQLGLRDSSRPGLVDAIVNAGLSLDDIVEPRPPFNLSVIRAGQTPPSPYEVLKSPRLGELLEGARGRFDYVLLDTPPLVPVQDCRLIGRWVDGFLLVVAADRTPARLVEEALRVIDPARMIGLIFNRDEHRLSHYYSGCYFGSSFRRGERPSSNGHSTGAWSRAMRRLSAPFGTRSSTTPRSRRAPRSWR